MEVHILLKKAYEEVKKSDIPERYQLKAYEKAIDLIAQTSSVRSSKLLGESTDGKFSQDSQKSVIGLIADKLNIEPETIAEVYYQEEDDLEIIIGSSKLDESLAGATQEIALLVAGGRQLGGLDEWTSSDIVREKCEFHGKYDYSNFAKTIKRMDDVFSFKGNGQNREVKIIRPGIEELRELILSKTGRDK